MEEKVKKEKNEGNVSKKVSSKETITKEKGKKAKTGKVILIIIAVIIALFVICTFRKYYIVLNLQNKILEYSNSENFHLKNYNYEVSGAEVIMDYYKKGEKQVVIMQVSKDGNKARRSMYNNGKRVDTFIETENSKIAQLNTGTTMSVGVYNKLETDNAMQTLFT